MQPNKMPIDFQLPRTSSSQTAMGTTVACKKCVAAICDVLRELRSGLFSGAKIAPFFSHKMCDELKKRCHNDETSQALRCQVGRVGSCVPTMVALAAQILRSIYTYHIRAAYAALRLSGVQNLLHADLAGLGRASLSACM